MKSYTVELPQSVVGRMEEIRQKVQEEEFWSFVARERAALEQAREVEEVPTLLEWLEREIQEARETAFSLSLRGENGAEYWTGYADALEDVLGALHRREVRV